MNVDQDLQKILAGDIRFASSQDEEEVFHQDDLIQLFPYGLSINPENSRPFLLLKDATHDLTLPVALNNLEAGATLSISNKSAPPQTPHRFSKELMDSLGITAQQCVFVQIKGTHQYVRIYLQGHPGLNSIKLRADEAMSLCQSLSIPVFASRGFINRSKLLTAELEGLNQGLKGVPQALQRQHTYIQ